MADEYADPAVQQLVKVLQVTTRAAGHDRNPHIRVQLDEVISGRQIGLGQAEDGGDTGGMGSYQDAVDHPGTRWGIGEGGDDDHLIGVGNDGTLMRISVIGRAPQDGGPVLGVDDSGQGSLGT